MQGKQKVSNHTNSGQAKMNFLAAPALLYSLRVGSFGINVVYHDLIPPKYSLRVSL